MSEEEENINLEGENNLSRLLDTNEPVIAEYENSSEEENNDVADTENSSMNKPRTIKLSKEEISEIPEGLASSYDDVTGKVDRWKRFSIGFKFTFKNFKFIFKHDIYRTFFFEWHRGIFFLVLLIVLGTFNRSIYETAIGIFYAGIEDPETETPHRPNVIVAIIFYSLSAVISAVLLLDVVCLYTSGSLRLSAYQRVIYFTEEAIRGATFHVDWREITRIDCSKKSCGFIRFVNKTCFYYEYPVFFAFFVIFIIFPPGMIIVRLWFYGFLPFKMLFITRGEYWRTWKYCWKKENFWLVMGIGLAGALLDFIPILNFFASIASTCSGTRLFYHLEYLKTVNNNSMEMIEEDEIGMIE